VNREERSAQAVANMRRGEDVVRWKLALIVCATVLALWSATYAASSAGLFDWLDEPAEQLRELGR